MYCFDNYCCCAISIVKTIFMLWYTLQCSAFILSVSNSLRPDSSREIVSEKYEWVHLSDSFFEFLLFVFAVNRVKSYSLAKRMFLSRHLICHQACVHLFRAKIFAAFCREKRPWNQAFKPVFH